MGILPYGYKLNHKNNINKATKSLISKFPEKNPNIHYTDIGHIYLDFEGKVRQELMPDYLHPNIEGHLLMFEALDDDITRLMVELHFSRQYSPQSTLPFEYDSFILVSWQ